MRERRGSVGRHKEGPKSPDLSSGIGRLSAPRLAFKNEKYRMTNARSGADLFSKVGLGHFSPVVFMNLRIDMHGVKTSDTPPTKLHPLQSFSHLAMSRKPFYFSCQLSSHWLDMTATQKAAKPFLYSWPQFKAWSKAMNRYSKLARRPGLHILGQVVLSAKVMPSSISIWSFPASSSRTEAVGL